MVGRSVRSDWPSRTLFKWPTCPGHWLHSLDTDAAETTSDLWGPEAETAACFGFARLPVGRTEREDKDLL